MTLIKVKEMEEECSDGSAEEVASEEERQSSPPASE